MTAELACFAHPPLVALIAAGTIAVIALMGIVYVAYRAGERRAWRRRIRETWRS